MQTATNDVEPLVLGLIEAIREYPSAERQRILEALRDTDRALAWLRRLDDPETRP